MRGWVVDGDAEPDGSPELGVRLRPAELPEPQPAPGEVRVRVSACGVCRTDLHLAQGDLIPRRPRTVPGHEIVGRVDALGAAAERFAVGDRVGIAWLRHTCGRCRWCRRGRGEPVPAPRFTGWDADGGFAELAVVPEAYAYRLPDGVDDADAAPLLCAGIVGYRALRRADPAARGPAGDLRFRRLRPHRRPARDRPGADGARAHAVAQARELATRWERPPWGAPTTPRPSRWTPPSSSRPPANWCPPRCGPWTAGDAGARRHPPLRRAPAELPAGAVPRGEVRSVTANTRADGEEFLRLAGRSASGRRSSRRPLSAAGGPWRTSPGTPISVRPSCCPIFPRTPPATRTEGPDASWSWTPGPGRPLRPGADRRHRGEELRWCGSQLPARAAVRGRRRRTRDVRHEKAAPVRALVLYESLFGNTAAVADAVAEGIRAARPEAVVDCRRVDDQVEPDQFDLVVLGAPTHFWGLTGALSRAMESQYERRLRGGAGLEVAAAARRAVETTGMRARLATLPPGRGRAAAAFDTCMTRPLTGGARRAMARNLERAGYRLLSEPESFLVEAVAGPPAAGEVQRARAWGAGLGYALSQQQTPNWRKTMERHDADVLGASDGAIFDGTPRAAAAAAARTPPLTPKGPARGQHSSLDVTRLVTTAEVVLGAVLVARYLSRRPGSSKALVTMGPGGWVSMKGGTVAVRRGSRPWPRPTPVQATPGERVPLWARVLSAVPLQALMR